MRSESPATFRYETTEKGFVSHAVLSFCPLYFFVVLDMISQGSVVERCTHLFLFVEYDTDEETDKLLSQEHRINAKNQAIREAVRSDRHLSIVECKCLPLLLTGHVQTNSLTRRYVSPLTG